MIKVVITFVFALMLSATAWAGNWNSEVYKDADWTHPFYKSCELPTGSVNWLEEGGNRFLRFTLEDGQKGNCSRDRINRNNAPYHERAEINSGSAANSKVFLQDGKKYLVDFYVRLFEGFNSQKESIIQVYNLCKGPGRCMPPVMIRSHGEGVVNGKPMPSKLLFETVSKANNWEQIYSRIEDKNGQAFDTTENLGKWITIRMLFDVRANDLDVSVEIVGENNRWSADKKTTDRYGSTSTFLKIGLYRPGGFFEANSKTSIDFGSIKIKELSKSKHQELSHAFFYNRTEDGLIARLNCLKSHSEKIMKQPFLSNEEVAAYVAALSGTDWKVSNFSLRKLGLSKESINMFRNELVNLANHKGNNEDYCKNL